MTFETWYAAECERLHALPDGQRESWCRAAWEAAAKRCVGVIEATAHNCSGQYTDGLELAVELIKQGDNSVNTG